MMPIIVAFLVGTVLAALVPIVPFAFIGILVLGFALAGMSVVDALAAFACLQAGYVGGLVLRALVGRFQPVTHAASPPDERKPSVVRARYFIRQAFPASNHE